MVEKRKKRKEFKMIIYALVKYSVIIDDWKSEPHSPVIVGYYISADLAARDVIVGEECVWNVEEIVVKE